MNRKFVLAIAFLFALAVSAPVAVSAEISVGVKQGDWAEYQVAFTGTPDPGHDVSWARIEVVDVQGVSVNLAVASKFVNGTWLNQTLILNLEAGQLGDDLIIPANLNIGDTFYDDFKGNLTISGAEEKTYAGVKRAVVNGTTAESTYCWDRATGVLVEGNSSYTEFTMYMKLDKTNMWQAQTVGLEPTVFYVLVIGAAIVIVAMVALFVMRRKK